MAEFSFTYRAFISYSYGDKEWGAWLQDALERYRVPRRLAGRDGPRRLGKVFRDETDMGAGATIGPKIEEAIKSSDVLIVICSPRSAGSRWVNDEIAEFRKRGREDRIFAVIVDGDPHGKNGPECFPAALLETAAGEATEPLAVDVRKFGREDAVLRLIAGMLEVGYDDLRQREMQRARAARHRAWAISASAFALVSAVLIAGWFAVQNYQESIQRRAALFAREANSLSDEEDYPKAMLMALAGVNAQRGIFASPLRRDGYAEARAALERAYTHNRLIATIDAGAEVVSVAFMHDTDRILTGLENGTATLWKIGEVRPLQEFSGHGGPIRSIAVAPDGEHFLTGSEDQTAKLWRLGEGQPIRTFAKQEAGVNGVVFGADVGRVITSSGWTARLWNTSQIEPIATYGGAQWSPVFSIADTPDGARALTVTFAETVDVWRIGSRDPIQTFSDRENGIFFASLSPDGSQVLTGSKDGTLRLWRVRDAKTRLTFVGHGTTTSAAFTPDGKTILVGSSNGTAMLWLIPEDKQTYTFASHGLPPSSFTSVDRPGAGKLPSQLLVGHRSQIVSVAISADGARALTGSKDGTAKLWNIRGEPPIQSSDGVNDQIDPFLLLTANEQVTVACAKLSEIGVREFTAGDRERFQILKGEVGSPCASR